VTQHVIDRRKIETHLAGEFRLESSHFQIDEHEGTELEMVAEEGVDEELLATGLKPVLIRF
jgi:hypothetical protein